MTTQTKHFELSFWADDAAYGAKISMLIEDVYSRVTTIFKIPDAKETYRLVLCRDVSEYLRETGKTADHYEPCSGIYVWYLIHRYGAEVFKKLYTGTRDIRPYITASFEMEAVETFFRERTGKGEFCK